MDKRGLEVGCLVWSSSDGSPNPTTTQYGYLSLDSCYLLVSPVLFY